jgi:hypothetical protein
MPYMASAGFSGQIKFENYGSNSKLELIEDFVKALCYITGTNYDEVISITNFACYRYKLKDLSGKYIFENSFYSHRVAAMDNDYKKILEIQKKYPNSIIEDSKVNWGEWVNWSFFRIKCFKKGTVHFEFMNEDVWALFNQHVSRIKGYPLFEGKEQTSYQKKQAGRKI